MEAAFFDLDKSVIARSSVLAYGRPLYREGLVPRIALIRSVYGQALYRLGGAGEARMDRARDSMLSLVRGWEQARVTGVVRDAFEKVVAPMLEVVGHPVAVNPDRDLARLAREREWEIRHFHQPVRLRQRAAPGAAVGGMVIAAGVGLAVRWLRQRPAS